jgi:hypothetical protein
VPHGEGRDSLAGVLASAGRTASRKLPGAGGRFSGHRYGRPGLAVLRGPRGFKVAKKSRSARHASVPAWFLGLAMQAWVTTSSTKPPFGIGTPWVAMAERDLVDEAFDANGKR